MGSDPVVNEQGFRIRPTHGSTSVWSPSRHLKGTIHDVMSVLHSTVATVVLTGAGVSTDSGLPDYRGRNAAQANPMLFQEFVADYANRQRYWARNYQGWPHFASRLPNEGHRALVSWELTGQPNRLLGIITQNVDGLHEAAGSLHVIDLHGRSDEIVCLSCGARSSRSQLQVRLRQLNPDVPVGGHFEHAELRPDADAEVNDWSEFVVADCDVCGGILKPDVTFFGDTVPTDRVDHAKSWIDHADVVVAVGSTLTVMSGLRFVRMAKEQEKKIIIVNKGATRADESADIRLDMTTSDFLTAIVS